MSEHTYIPVAKHEYPELLYKFRTYSSENHKRVLANNELYLSSPKGFDDPYDTKIYPNFNIIDTDEKREEYTKLFFIKNYSLYCDKTDDYILLGNLMDKFKERLRNGDHELMYKEQWDYIYEHHLGILSLAEKRNGVSPESNMPMWNYYADKGKGYCVVFKGGTLIQEFQNQFGGTGGNVNYTDEFPDINPFEILDDHNFQMSEIAKKFTKAKKWDYENEYRLSALTPQVLGQNRAFKFSNEAVDRVILGYDISENDRLEIMDLCKSKGWPVYQAKPKERSFELEFHQIA